MNICLKKVVSALSSRKTMTVLVSKEYLMYFKILMSWSSKQWKLAERGLWKSCDKVKTHMELWSETRNFTIAINKAGH